MAKQPQKGKRPPNNKGRSHRKGKDQFTARQRAVESEDMKRDPRLTVEQRGEDDRHVGRPNDWRWYAQNPQLIRDFASYPFGTPVGNRLRTGVTGADTGSIPGIMVFQFVPMVGWADSENSPINVAMRKLYSFVRHANSGASNYDAPDLMLYMVAVDSALMFHSELKRLYGIFQDYTPFNRYWPRYVVESLGYDYNSIESQLNDLRGYINLYASKLSQLWIPNSMSYMARHSWMVEGIYTDSNTEKAQTYAYAPVGYWQFSLDSNGVGQLTMKTKASTASASPKLTFSQIVSLGNSLLNAMIPNEDFGIMSGDILKAFGPSGIVRVEGITEEYKILPVYNQEVLSQMENATIMRTTTWSNFKVTQATAVGTGFLQATPYVTQSFVVGAAPTSDNMKQSLLQGITQPLVSPRILNFHHSSPTPEEVMVATRLMHIPTYSPDQTWPISGNNGTVLFDLTNVGSELVVGAWIYQLEYTKNGAVLMSYEVSTVLTGLVSFSDAALTNNVLPTRLAAIENLAQFDWHPGVWFTIVTNDGGSGESDYMPYRLPLMDLDFYTTVDETNLFNMTAAALLSEFSIPQI